MFVKMDRMIIGFQS